VGPPAPAGDPKRWPALAVTQAAAFMTLLDVSIVNVALPSIERDLGASAPTVQWVVSGYALTFRAGAGGGRAAG
jgi:MFS family permease